MIERSEQGADPDAAAAPDVPGGVDPSPGPVPWAAPRWAPPPPPPPPPPAPPPSLPFKGSGPLPEAPAGHRSRTDGTLGAQLAAGAAPSTRSSAWMWLLFFALGFLAGQIVAEIFAAVTAALEGQSGSLGAIAKLSEPPTWYIVSTLAGLWAGFFGSAWLASRVRGTKSLPDDLGLRFRWSDLIGIPIGAGGQVVVALMYIPISHHVHDFSQRFSAPSNRLTGGSHGGGFVLIAVLTVVGAPFFEELYFRGVLLRALTRLFGGVGGWVGPAAAVVTTGLVFGLFHFEALQFAGLATFGILLSVIAYRTGRLGMNMVAHATFNLLAVAAAVIVPAGLMHGTAF